MAEVAEFINKLGFPIFVAVYMLWRLDKVQSHRGTHEKILERLDDLEKAVKENTDKCILLRSSFKS